MQQRLAKIGLDFTLKLKPESGIKFEFDTQE